MAHSGQRNGLIQTRAEKGGSLRKELVLPYKFGFGGIKYDFPSQNTPYSLFGVQYLQFLPTVDMTEEFLSELCKSEITSSAIVLGSQMLKGPKKRHIRMTTWVALCRWTGYKLEDIQDLLTGTFFLYIRITIKRDFLLFCYPCYL
jgi:hypothetical protein